MRRLGTRLLCCALALPLLALSSAPRNLCAQAGENAALSVHVLATETYKAGDFKKAAELYHTAYKIDPQPAFLFNAARSEQRLVMLDVAEKHFKQLLALKDLDERTRTRTKMHLQEIAAVRKAMAVAQAKAAALAAKAAANPASKPPAKPANKPVAKPAAATAPKPAAAAIPAVTATAGDGAWKAPAGWASLGTGVVLTGLGGWLLISYLGDQATLDEQREKLGPDGKVVGISHEKYEQDQQALWTRRGLGYGAAGVGLAAVGVGAWMLLTAPADATVTLAPAGRGVTLAWRF